MTHVIFKPLIITCDSDVVIFNYKMICKNKQYFNWFNCELICEYQHDIAKPLPCSFFLLKTAGCHLQLQGLFSLGWLSLDLNSERARSSRNLVYSTQFMRILYDCHVLDHKNTSTGSLLSVRLTVCIASAQMWHMILPHDDVIKWKQFPRYWPFVREIHRWLVNSLHKGQRRRALMFSLTRTWINDWVSDLRRRNAYHDVIVMIKQHLHASINQHLRKRPGGRLSIKMSSYQYRDLCISQPSYL